MRKIHLIKCYDVFFNDLLNVKMFELRKDDRNYQVGDVLEISEYVPNVYLTGRVKYAIVTYKLSCFAGLEQGYCILGLRKMSLLERLIYSISP
jgi:ParB family chromosome partitioning protein